MNFALLQHNIIEKGASAKLDNILVNLKIKRPLIITDENLVRYCRRQDDIQFSKDIDISLINLSDFSTYDGIIGVGGGVVLDKAHYLSFKLKVPFVSFATSLSTDAMSSSTIPGSNFIKTPDAVLIDLDIINNSPKRLSVAGYGELMAKISANLDWKLANKEKGESYDKDISQLASGSAYIMLDFVLNTQKNKFNLLAPLNVNVSELFNWGHFNQKLSKSLFLCGLLTSLTKNSRPISGSEHLFEKALLDNKKIKTSALHLHGEIVGVSTLLFTYLHELENKDIKGTTDKLKTSYKKIGAPTSFKELGIDFEGALQSLLVAHKKSNRYTILRNGLDKDFAANLLKKFY